MILALGLFAVMTLAMNAQNCGPNASYVTSSCVSGCASVYSRQGHQQIFIHNNQALLK
jgi:hypothetical protein